MTYSVKEILENSEKLYGEKTAFSFFAKDGERKNISYNQFKSDVDNFSVSLLYKYNLRGEKIGIVAANCYRWCVAYLSCLCGTAVAVPIDRELSGEDICKIIDFAGVKAVVCDKNAEEKIKEAFKGETLPIIISVDDSETALSFTSLLNEGQMLRNKNPGLFILHDEKPDNVAVILFTSGTTGVSKGVMLTRKNLLSDLFAVKDFVEISENDRSLSLLPLHHTYESISLLMTICCGGTVCFCTGIKYLSECFKEFSPTVFVTVPLILERLHKKILADIEKSGKRQKFKLMSLLQDTLSEEKKNRLFAKVHEQFGGELKKFIVGAAHLNEKVAEDFELFGFQVIIGYGLTECSPIVICNSVNDRTTDTVGRPLKNVEVQIKNPDEKGIGELLVKGDMVMKGYYKNPEITKEVFDGQWFCTGDLGFCDKNGRYHITGRSKNVIVTKNGKNVYPEELEYHLNKSPYVKESLVFAVGEIVSCEVFPDEETVAKKLKKTAPADDEVRALIGEVVRSVNRKVPSFKRIKQLTVRKTEFPKTTTNKVKRNRE